MPCDYRKYSPMWCIISRQAVDRANNKCELCYAPNSTKVLRGVSKGEQYPWYTYSSGHCGAFRPTRIVLTVHHIDGDTQNNDRHNLIALCQRCHLRLDIAKHIRNRKDKQCDT